MIAIAAAVVVIVFIGVFLWKYFSAIQLAKQWKFTKANDTLFLGGIANIWDSNFDEYLEAGLKLDNRDYTNAQKEFFALGAYRDSKELEKECRYRRAAQLADQNEYEESLKLYGDLTSEQYRDAQDCVQETRYRQAVYQLYELGEYETAYRAFAVLSDEGYQKADAMILETQYWWACALAEEEDYLNSYKKFQECSSYEDAQKWIDALAPIIYEEGQALYHQAYYSAANEYFSAIDPYSSSTSYLTLISLRKRAWCSESQINELISLIGFEDAGEILFQFSNACLFMEGYWSGNCGYIKFYEGSDSWWGQWILPSVPNATWYFSNGSFYTGDKERFSIYATSYDSVVITITATGKSYTLWRS